MSIPAVGPRFGLVTRIIANDSSLLTDQMDKLDKPGVAQLSTITEETSGRPYALVVTGHDITKVLKALELNPKDYERTDGLQRRLIGALEAAYGGYTSSRDRAILALRSALVQVLGDTPDHKVIDLTGGEPYKPKEVSIPTADSAEYDDTGSGILRD